MQSNIAICFFVGVYLVSFVSPTFAHSFRRRVSSHASESTSWRRRRSSGGGGSAGNRKWRRQRWRDIVRRLLVVSFFVRRGAAPGEARQASPQEAARSAQKNWHDQGGDPLVGVLPSAGASEPCRLDRVQGGIRFGFEAVSPECVLFEQPIRQGGGEIGGTHIHQPR